VSHAAAIVARYYESSGGGLLVGGSQISEIVDAYPTPLFIYDSGVLERKWQLLRNALPPEFHIYYSVKANPNRAILKFFLERGSGLEIASAGEFCQAVQAGCPPEKIVFAGPGKSEAELELVLKNQIGEVHIESLLEGERIGAISRREGLQAKVAVRVNPAAEAQGGAMRMGGKPAPFGIDEEKLDEVLERLLSEPGLKVQGVHLFAGTQILDYRILISQYRKGLQIAKRVAKQLRESPMTMDFGGGLGVPYFAGETELDMDGFRRELTELMREIKAEPLFEATRFIVEPGRYLVGEAGIYVTRITDIKVSRGKTFLIADGGMNHHLAASGNLGQVIKRNFPLALLNRIDSAEQGKADVVGPLCTPLDVLGRDVQLPAAEIGDLIGVFQSGAYARSASPMSFLSRPAPAEVLISNGEARLVRRAGTVDEWARDIP